MRPKIGRFCALLRRVLAPLRSRSALSFRGPLIILPVAWVAQVMTNWTAHGGSVVLWLSVTLAGFVVVLGGLAVVRRLLGSRVPSPLLVVGVFVALGLARSLTVGLGSVAVGLAPVLDVTTALLVGLVTVPALLVVGGHLVSRHDAHRALVADLEAKRQALLDTERTMDAQLAKTTAELATAVGGSLQPAIGALEEALREAERGASTGPVLAALGELIDGRVRPLSHQLMWDREMFPVQQGPEVAGPIRVRVPLPARFPIAGGIRPGPAALLGGLVAITPAFHDVQPLQAGTYVVALVAWSWALLSLARLALGGIELATPLTITAVAAVHVLVTRPFAAVYVALGGHVPAGTRITGILIWALIGVSMILIALVDARRAATQAELAVTVERLTASVGVIRRRAGLTRRRLAHLLHGSLQGALLAAAVRLTESPPDRVLIESVRGDVEKALARLDVDPAWGAEARLNQTLDEIAGTWGEQRSITATVDPEAAAVLAAQRDADEAIALVVREAVTNALRHGRARSVDASVALHRANADAQGRLEILVRDDGVGWSSDSASGLGTSLYDELCHTWSHASDEHGTRFTASVTVA